MNSGVHYLPLIDAPKATNEQLESLTNQRMAPWLNEQLSNGSVSLQRVSSSIKVTIMDGTFSLDDCFDLDTNFELIEGRSSEKRYRAAMNVKTGKRYSDKVLQFLRAKHRKRGPSGPKYERAREVYESRMCEHFYRTVLKELSPDIQQLDAASNLS